MSDKTKCPHCRQRRLKIETTFIHRGKTLEWCKCGNCGGDTIRNKQESKL